MSRRRFLGVSMASGFAGVIPWGATSGNTDFREMEGGGRVLTLRVIGNSSNGYGVTVLFGAIPVARHNSGGEFNAVFQNEERSLEDRAENWRASSWTGDKTHVTLHGEHTAEHERDGAGAGGI